MKIEQFDFELRENEQGLTTGYNIEQIKLRDDLIEFCNDNRNNEHLQDRLCYYGSDKILTEGFESIEDNPFDEQAKRIVVKNNGEVYTFSTTQFVAIMRRYFANAVEMGEFDYEMMKLMVKPKEVK